MTVSNETNRSGPYNGNGVTTVFDYDFRIINEAHLSVILRDADGNETTLTLTTDYSVSGVGDTAGGQIASVAPPASGKTITILRHVPFTQETDLENQGAYYAETVETALDLAAMRDQQMAETIDRSVKVPVSYGTDAPTLTASTPGRALIISADGEAIEDGPSADEIEGAQASANLAIATLAAMLEKYLGSLPVDPTETPQGLPLTIGAMYFNTIAAEIRFYDGSTWIALEVDVTALMVKSSNLADVTNVAEARANIDVPVRCGNIAEFKAIDPTFDTVALYAGRVWEWTTGDYTAKHAADTTNILYVKADSVASTVGSWVAKNNGEIDAALAGVVVDDGTGTNYINVQLSAALTLIGAGGVVRVTKPGLYNINGQIGIPGDTTLYLAKGVTIKNRLTNTVMVSLNGDRAAILSDGGPRGGYGAAVLDCSGVASGINATQRDGVIVRGLTVFNTLNRGINVIRSTRYTIERNYVYWDAAGVAAKVAYIAGGGTTFMAGIWCASHEGAVSGNWNAEDPYVCDNHVSAMAFLSSTIPFFVGIGVRGDEIGTGVMSRLVFRGNLIELQIYTIAQYEAANPYWPAARSGGCEIRTGVARADITHNDIRGGDIALSLGNLTDSVITSNRLQGGAHYCLELASVNTSVVQANDISGASSWYAVSYNGCADVPLVGNYIRGADTSDPLGGAIVTSGTIVRGQIVGNNILVDAANVSCIRVNAFTTLSIVGNVLRCLSATVSYPVIVQAAGTRLAVSGNIIEGGTNALRINAGVVVGSLAANGNVGASTGAYANAGTVTLASAGNSAISGWS